MISKNPKHGVCLARINPLPHVQKNGPNINSTTLKLCRFHLGSIFPTKTCHFHIEDEHAMKQRTTGHSNIEEDVLPVLTAGSVKFVLAEFFHCLLIIDR